MMAIRKYWDAVLLKINSVDSLFYLLCAIASNRITSLLPKYCYFDPFPFYDIVDKDGNNVGITLQSFWFMLSGHFIMVMFWNYIMKRSNNEKPLFFLFKWFELASFLDFFLLYEQSFCRIGFFGIEITDFKLIGYFTFYILWKSGRSRF